jgi:hypothetical protein
MVMMMRRPRSKNSYRMMDNGTQEAMMSNKRKTMVMTTTAVL